MNSTIATVTNYDDSLKLPPRGQYKALCITNLVLCSISTILCAVIILAMVVPLFYPTKRARYSTYNLYLAYMAIPDLVANAFIVYLLLAHNGYFQWMQVQGELNTQQNETTLWMFDHRFDNGIFMLCVTSNLYINTFLVFEIYQLLKNSKNRRRHSPPTLSRVTKQALISFGIGFVVFFVDYWVSVKNTIERTELLILYQACSVILVVCIPLAILVSVCLLIHKQNLIQSTGSMYEGRLKILIVFFARIVLVGLLLWLPASLIYMVSWTQREVQATKILAYNVAIVFSGSQAIVSFAFSLTKPDTRKLILDLTNCVYCLQCGCGSDERPTPGNEYSDDPYLRSSLPSTKLFSPTSAFSSKRTFGRSSKGSNEVTLDGQKSCSQNKKNVDCKEEVDSPDPQGESSISDAVLGEV